MRQKWCSNLLKIALGHLMSFHFIPHTLISEIICFVFFACMDYLGCYDIWWKFQVNNIFRNIFTEKNGDAFNTYFTCCKYN